MDDYKDDIFDIFFSNNKNKIKKFKKIRKSKKKEKSFTLGLDDNDENNYQYLYFSDSEKKRNKIYKKLSKDCKYRIDYYLKTKNDIYDKKLKNLRLKLSNNKLKKNKTKNILYTQEELRDEFLSEKKIKTKNFLDDIFENRPLKCDDIIYTFKLLKNEDPTMDLSKFYKMKKTLKYFYFIDKNIKDNTDKYYNNRKRTNINYPSLINYNVPKILKDERITLKDLIKYYTKFRCLINLWLNSHKDINNIEYGIDFETFYKCSEELSNEEEDLVKKIYEKMNNSSTSFLSLGDYIQALNDMNQNDLVRQFNFFLKVFGNIGKKYLSYNDIYEISLIAIKRLVHNKQITKDIEIIKDLGSFFANYIFKLCEANVKEGIEIAKLRGLLNSQGEKLEYLKLLLIFIDEKKKNTFMKTLDEFRKKNNVK